MRVMITGATGFIGGSVARRLLARGDSVVVLARRASRAQALGAAGATVIEGGLCDAAALRAAARGCDVVIHSAGVPRPASWATFREVHIAGTQSVIDAAKTAGVRRVVNIASQAVMFGGRDLIGVNESVGYPKHFVDPYSVTKAAAEQVALRANDRGGLEVTSLRPAVVWGRGDSTVLPIMAKLALSPLGVPMCGDGSNIEATTHIENLVDAIVLAMTAAAAPARAYLVLDGFRVTWRECLAKQLEAAGVRQKFGRAPRLIAEPMAMLLDQVAALIGAPVPLALFGVRTAQTSRDFVTTRARDELGYTPRVGLEDGLADLRAWVREIGGPKGLIGLMKRG